MQERRLGHSGLRVSRVALGTMTFGTSVDEVVAQDQLRAFVSAGGSLVDTAPTYGDGHGEVVLGEAIAKLGVRDQVVLAGKAGLSRREGRRAIDGSRRSLLSQLDASLQRLGTDHLDLWQLHQWDPSTPLDETLGALEVAVTSGRVRYAGVCNYTGWQFALAHATVGLLEGVPVVSNQVEYSLLNRSCEGGVRDAAAHLGSSLLAWAPLGRGVLTGKYRDGTPADSRAAKQAWENYVSPYLAPERSGVVEALARASEGLSVPMSQVALAWLRDRPQVASVIVGARTVAQLTQSLASEDIDLPSPIADALDDVSAVQPEWEI